MTPAPCSVVRPRRAELREISPLHGLGHLIMDQSYVCALIAMMVRSNLLGFPHMYQEADSSPWFTAQCHLTGNRWSCVLPRQEPPGSPTAACMSTCVCEHV